MLSYGLNSSQSLYDEFSFGRIRDLIALDVVRDVAEHLVEVHGFKELVEGDQLQAGNAAATDSWWWRRIREGTMCIQLDVLELIRAWIGKTIWELSSNVSTK